mmetsp:Transcript_17709/g.33338  ORF Transcript_17709/g.33338 Transcript_17709/m.33338 type:complete len:627 (-) Transcript_17709:79-1959(-)
MWSLHSHFDHHRRCRTRRTTTASLSSRPRQPWQSLRHKDHDNNNHHHSYNNHYSSSDDDEYYEPRQQSKHRHGDGYHRVDDRVIAPHEEQAFLRTLLFMVSTDHRSEREHDKDDNEQPPQQQQPQQYQPHVVLPDDTWQGICLRYKITPLQLRRANGGFSGTQLTLAPPVLKIPVTQPNNNNNNTTTATTTPTKSDAVKSLQVRFLSVFWLLRCSDWLQGPYFYEVYASKVFGNGVPASMALVSRLFLTGFASTALFGPVMGRAADQYGRKKATLAFSIIYALGAISTKSPFLVVLLLGRVLSGMGTSLLFSAPESWLVGAAQANNDTQAALGETFGLAYAGDSLVAIAAGQMAGWAAARRGPTGPFELSTGFLAAGGLLAAWLWKENKAQSSGSHAEGGGGGGKHERPSIGEAIKVIKRDPKIISVGAVQSLFESAMYIFVLQWPPAVAAAVTQYFGPNSVTPYGTVFSCFMASCLLGSTLFGQLSKQKVPTEASTTAMLSVATVAMGAATWAVRAAGSGATAVNTLPQLIAALFCFEACVGMYFPSIGTLRSRYVPDSHRSVIMNLFGIPLNVLVVAVFLSIHKLGVTGALTVSSMALGVATLAMGRLWRQTSKGGTTEVPAEA